MTRQEKTQRRKDVSNDILAGLSIKEVTEKYDIGYDTVLKACKEHGVIVKYPNKTRNNKVYKILADLINTQDTLTQIAERHNVTKQYVSIVYTLSREAGIQIQERKHGNINTHN